MTRGLIWGFLGLLVAAWPLDAATRLGLHVTTEERAIWVQRTTQGPYRVAGDVRTNSPGDWTRILGKANTFLSNPAVDRRVGQSSASCVQPNNGLDISGNRVIGDKLRDAAFVYLITGTLTYRTAVINELLAQAAVVGTNQGDTTRWCPSVALGDVDPTFDMATWQTKLLFGYDYILAGDAVHGQTLPAGNKTTLDTWFLNSALFWENNIGQVIEKRFPSRDSDTYSNPTTFGVGSGPYLTHYAGYTNYGWHRAWTNRGMSQVRFFSAVGVQQNHSALKLAGKRFFKEVIKYATWPDNTLVEYERWQSTFPTLGHGYSGYVVHGMVQMADHYARAGDTELYTYTTSDGHQGTAGGTKSLLGVIQLFHGMVNGVVTRYGTDQAANNGNIDYRIDTVYEPRNWFSIGDVWDVQAVTYYQNAAMKSYVLRTCSGCPGYPSSPAHGGFEPWSGEWGTFPGVLFMFGQMDTLVNPYNVGGDTTPPNPPTDLTVDCTTSSTCNWAWTAGAGEAAATYEALFCVNAGCTPSTPVSFAGPAVSYTHTNLTASTLYRVQLRAKDAAGNASAYTTIAEDTTAPTPAPDLVLHYTFNSGTISGATVQDQGTFDHDGTLVGSPTTEAGDDGLALVLDGIDDYVRIPRHADLEPAALTVCVRVKPVAPVVTNSDIINKTWKNDTGPTFTSYAMQLNQNGTSPDLVSFRHGHSTGLSRLDSSAGAAPAGVFTDICQRYDPASQAPQKGIFVEGNLDQSANITTAMVYDTAGTPGSTATGDLYIGTNGAGRFFKGSIDEVRIYNGKLSDADIAALALGEPEPEPTGVYAQTAYCWTRADHYETEACRGVIGTSVKTGIPGRIVQGSNARVRVAVGRTVDTPLPTELELWCRSPAGSGTWWLLDEDCEGNPFCYGFDRRLENAINTTNQLVATETYASGGKFYKAFGERLDQFIIPAGKALEFEIPIRAAFDTALTTTIGCCMRLGDGTELDSCSEATATTVAPGSYGP